MIEYCNSQKYAFPLGHAAHLMACLNASCWPESPLAIRQIQGIGKKWGALLNQAGIKSISDVAGTDPRRIELVLKWYYLQ